MKYLEEKKKKQMQKCRKKLKNKQAQQTIICRIKWEKGNTKILQNVSYKQSKDRSLLCSTVDIQIDIPEESEARER